MQLSLHFSLDELTHSEWAARNGVDNYPPPDVIENLRQVAVLMEHVRGVLGGKPIIVHSGYRSPAVNKGVGGSDTSAHRFGLACDFICPAFGTPLQVARAIRDAGVEFDQLILEYGWVHIGLPTPLHPMRKMLMTKRGPKSPYEVGINA